MANTKATAPETEASAEIESYAEFSQDIATAERPPLTPVGEYPATIIDAKIALSKKNTKYADVTFSIERDAFPADFAELVGPTMERKQLHYRRLSLEDNPQSRFNLRQFLEAIGSPASKVIRPSEWVGLEAKIGVDHDTYQGVTNEQIKKVSSAS